MFTESSEYIFRGSRLLTSLEHAIAGEQRAELHDADDYHRCIALWLLHGHRFLGRRRIFGKLINHRSDDKALARGLSDLIEQIFQTLPSRLAELIERETDANVVSDLKQVAEFVTYGSFLINVAFGLEVGQYLYEEYRRLEPNRRKLDQMLNFGAFSRQVVRALFDHYSWYQPQMLGTAFLTHCQDLGLLNLLPIELFFSDLSVYAKTLNSAFYHYRFEEPIALRTDGISLHTKDERYRAWLELKSAYQAEKNAVGKSLFELSQKAELDKDLPNVWLMQYIWVGDFSRLVQSQLLDTEPTLQFGKLILGFVTPESFRSTWRVYATEENSFYVFSCVQALANLLTFLVLDPDRYPELCLLAVKLYSTLMQGLYDLAPAEAVQDFETFLGLRSS